MGKIFIPQFLSHAKIIYYNVIESMAILTAWIVYNTLSLSLSLSLFEYVYLSDVAFLYPLFLSLIGSHVPTNS